MKRKVQYVAALLVLVITLLAGCGNHSSMPYNGAVVFHDVSITIPEAFIRDSGQSNEDLWAFERGLYQQIIILKRTDAYEGSAESIEALMEQYESMGGASEKLDQYENVYSAQYTKDGVLCREVFFIFGDSVYCIAMRGASEEEFAALLDTVAVTTPQQ